MTKRSILRRFAPACLGALILAGSPAAAQQVLEAAPDSPLRYEKRDGRLLVHSHLILSGSAGKDLVLTLDGQPLEWEATSRGDSLGLWLPLVGAESTIGLHRKKTLVGSFRVQAPVDSDWGYFKDGEIHLIQSSHQDIAWMDTPEYCRHERIEDIIIPALALMREDPDFTFEMEQTLNLMEFLEAYPGRKDEVVARYRERRFFWGATFNQPYEGLSSAEQLVRQAYFGRKWIKDNLPGCDDRTAFNVDVPGRAAQMPQILAKSGIRNLFISRFGEGFYDWRSPDGTGVFTYSPGNYGWATLEWKFFDGDVLSAFSKMRRRLALWDGYYRERGVPPCYAVLMSCDATKPRSFSEIFRQWNEIAELSEVPLPRVRYSNVETFLSKVDVPSVKKDVVQGERPDLWIYIHGPAHYDQTLDKRRAGVLLPAAEAFSSLGKVLWGIPYPADSLSRGWMASIYPDHGLGGKNGETTDRIFGDSLAVGRAIGEQVLQSRYGILASRVEGKDGDIVVFNDLPTARTAPLTVPCPVKGKAEVVDCSGNAVPSQMEADGQVSFLATVDGLGWARYRVVKAGRGSVLPRAEADHGQNWCSNSFYDITFGDGGIVRLYDKELGKEVVQGEKYALGDIYEAQYLGNGAGEFVRIADLVAGSGKSLASYPSNWKAVYSGNLWTVFENRVPTPYTTVVQKVTVHHMRKKIDFDIVLEDFTGEHSRQYRILFPLRMERERSDIYYEAPGVVSQVGACELDRVPMGWAWQGSYVHHPSETHPREVQNFMTASGGGFAFTMSSCVAAADWMDPAREIATYPVLQGVLLSSHKSCHGEGNWYHQAGTHSYHFSVTTHPEGWRPGYAHGVQENHPFGFVAKTGGGGSLPASCRLLSVGDPYVQVMALKMADSGEDALILRLVEMEGVDKEVTVRLPAAVKRTLRCSAIEEEQAPLPHSGDSLTLRLGHNAIETYKLFLE